MEITRRTFTKGALATLGAAAIGSASLSRAFVDTAAAAEDVTVEEAWKKGYCRCCCFENCGIEVKVVDGVATEVRGLKDHPINKGTLCPRGASVLQNAYNPYRVKAPLKRTNPEKGIGVDPGFIEISWDEAISTIEEHLKSIEPREFATLLGFAAGPHDRAMVKFFHAAYSQGASTGLLSCGPLCEIHYAPEKYLGVIMERPDLEYCNYLIALGHSIGGSVMYASGHARALAESLERGMKLVTVDPRCTPEASKGEWVPIRPGGDLAFLMGMLNVMLYEMEDGFDAASVKSRTNGPYLTVEDGSYALDAAGKPLIYDLGDNSIKAFDDPSLSDPALEGEYVYNGMTCRPAFSLIKDSVKESTPEWAEERSTIPAETIRRITHEFIDAACIGQTITIDGVEMPYRPACISASRGTAMTSQGRPAHYLAETIDMLVGGVGVPGSIIGCNADSTGTVNSYGIFEPGPKNQRTSVNDVDVVTADGKEKMLGAHSFYACEPMEWAGCLGTSFREMAHPENYYYGDKIKVFWPYGTNPFQCYANADEIAEGFKNIDFTWTNALNLDDVALMCDIVLPDSGALERTLLRPIENITAGNNDTIAMYKNINGQKRIIEPLYDSRQTDEVNYQILTDLGKSPMVDNFFCVMYDLQMGKDISPMRQYTFDEMYETVANKILGVEEGGMDWFAENVFFERKPRTFAECYDYCHADLKFGGVRYPIYDEPRLSMGRELKRQIEEKGVTMPGWEDKMDVVYREYAAVPGWKDNFITQPEDDSFDLYAINYKTTFRNLGNGAIDYNPWLKEIIRDWTIDGEGIQINSATAKAKGISTGDKIRVTSQHGGSLEGIAKVTELIHPDAVGFAGNGAMRSQMVNPVANEGYNYNQLLTSTEGYLVPDSGMLYNTARIKIEKIA